MQDAAACEPQCIGLHHDESRLGAAAIEERRMTGDRERGARALREVPQLGRRRGRDREPIVRDGELAGHRIARDVHAVRRHADRVGERERDRRARAADLRDVIAGAKAISDRLELAAHRHAPQRRVVARRDDPSAVAVERRDRRGAGPDPRRALLAARQRELDDGGRDAAARDRDLIRPEQVREVALLDDLIGACVREGRARRQRDRCGRMPGARREADGDEHLPHRRSLLGSACGTSPPFTSTTLASLACLTAGPCFARPAVQARPSPPPRSLRSLASPQVLAWLGLRYKPALHLHHARFARLPHRRSLLGSACGTSPPFTSTTLASLACLTAGPCLARPAVQARPSTPPRSLRSLASPQVLAWLGLRYKPALHLHHARFARLPHRRSLLGSACGTSPPFNSTTLASLACLTAGPCLARPAVQARPSPPPRSLRSLASPQVLAWLGLRYKPALHLHHARFARLPHRRSLLGSACGTSPPFTSTTLASLACLTAGPCLARPAVQARPSPPPRSLRSLASPQVLAWLGLRYKPAL